MDTATAVKWFAFKFTEKTEVGGKFDSFEVSSKKEGKSPKEVLEALVFSIATKSVNTTNPDRDTKIVDSFFGKLSKTEKITGKVISLEGDDKSGKAKVSIMMNEVTKDAELDYSIDESKISLTGTIDVAEWKGMPAIEALNKVCSDLHKGKDGLSKLWSEVRIEVTSSLAKNCGTL